MESTLGISISFDGSLFFQREIWSCLSNTVDTLVNCNFMTAPKNKCQFAERMGYEKYIRDENMTTKNINKKSIIRPCTKYTRELWKWWFYCEKSSNIFRPLKSAKKAEFSNSYGLKSVFRKLRFCEHRCSPVHMISSHTHPFSFIIHFFLSIYSYRENQQ